MAEQGTRLDSDPESLVSRYSHLPEPIRIEDTISSQQVEPAPAPEAGRDPEGDFMLRYAG